jgi:hypothetical protein
MLAACCEEIDLYGSEAAELRTARSL